MPASIVEVQARIADRASPASSQTRSELREALQGFRKAFAPLKIDEALIALLDTTGDGAYAVLLGRSGVRTVEDLDLLESSDYQAIPGLPIAAWRRMKRAAATKLGTASASASDADGEKAPEQSSSLKALLSSLTDAEISDYRETFRAFDKDGNGAISTKELQAIFAHVNVNLSAEEVSLTPRYAPDPEGDTPLGPHPDAHRSPPTHRRSTRSSALPTRTARARLSSRSSSCSWRATTAPRPPSSPPRCRRPPPASGKWRVIRRRASSPGWTGSGRASA